ncbi:Decaprenylphosphoryl-2-keto-beta-D-erythro-pentose reductase [Aliiroseovarius sp. xm-m-379]|nr:Decaprenylphosphoryl-2-keto-beta-D-erythro-pentose reductase [Aliiroseovarius sp. xm-d-517]NRP24731.1 Decaprenylphosphoryl-2-keto-beta-D-erythro-pentose reductase [Aliiroseovarius sp. xm-m-379]NRP30635.1 Decaprenylphosphoryl-2-keto-beta-D-erythro-pentose reductase [Aliiroseovarius sp. xm-m-314]NRP33530.1 Decaprenylphosphoryl-2-keto-beta-D-erythro-pentose reductase [Aliiroseovarius sp. xm-a-104]NRP40637.1 Decaprenylphosphoryl-2-keto-beta-D-erythro-pentose reductase [Aliiroseovarius sp. xm-m-3
MMSDANDTWIILGATSSMARAFARKVADQGAFVLLAGRDMNDLERSATDLRTRGLHADAIHFDARDPESFAAIISRVSHVSGVINAAVFVGSMPPQAQIDEDPSLIDGTVTDSFTGPARFLQMLAPLIETRGAGTVVGVGSVAGDRGRIGNYVYGAAKAGFATYLSGLRNRLTRVGGHVVTVKPGFVDTAMTWDVEGMFLVASPDKVAGDILKAVEKKRNVIYTPFFWRYIMLIIRHIPEAIFKKMSI